MERKRKTGRGICAGIFAALFSGLLVCLLAASAVVLRDMGTFDPDAILKAPRSLVVLDQDGERISDLFMKENRTWVPLETVPLSVRNAFLAVEDVRFYEHQGFDLRRILKAVYTDLLAGSYVQGASTISQQLVKLSHLSAEKKLLRKVQEILLACQMEETFTKDEILEMYLNYVYFGGGYYGIEAAARGYFGVGAAELTTAQGALLAGILKSPGKYAPHLNLQASRERRDLVLRLMKDNGFLDETACLQSQAEPVILCSDGTGNLRDDYIDAALEESCERLQVDMETLLSSGYRIYTYADPALQSACKALFENEENFPDPQVEGGLAVINVEKGGVAAMVGGRRQEAARAFNRAVDIRRQPGSVIKPILVYAPAMEYCGYTTVSMLLDEETDFNGYRPKNFNGSCSGWVTMREAVKRSLNIPAVSVLQQVGVERAKTFARNLGIDFAPSDDHLALALGGFTYGVSPLQVAGAYAAFAAGGVYREPVLVRRIEAADGTPLYVHQPESVRVMSEANAYILTDMLTSVIEDGTGKRLSSLHMNIAGKTGTTEDIGGNRDAWMAAYTPQYAAAVWMGYDTASNGAALANSVTGGTYPAMVLKGVFETLYPSGDTPAFVMPEDVQEYKLDGYTLEQSHVAVLANALTPSDRVVREVFAAGTEPVGSSGFWKVPAPPMQIQAALEDMAAVITFECPDSFILYSLYREAEDGTAVLVGRYPGSDGVVRATDTGAQSGHVYRYYVIPEHPELTLEGQRLTGPASEKVSLLLP